MQNIPLCRQVLIGETCASAKGLDLDSPIMSWANSSDAVMATEYTACVPAEAMLHQVFPLRVALMRIGSRKIFPP